MLLFGIWISEIWFFEFVKIGCLDFSKNSLCGKFSIITFAGTWTSISKQIKNPNNAVLSYFKWKHSNSRVCLLSRNEKSNWLSVNVTIGLYCFFFRSQSDRTRTQAVKNCFQFHAIDSLKKHQNTT